MNKNIFKDYIDVCELIKETEDKIRKLEEKSISQDVVSGSNYEYPFQPQHFHIGGVRQQDRIDYEYEQLKELNKRLESIKRQTEEIFLKASARIQRIIQYKFFDKLTWEMVAQKMGGNASGESIRKEFENFMKKIK